MYKNYTDTFKKLIKMSKEHGTITKTKIKMRTEKLYRLI